ncbi:MAG TPA: LuxR C-terminal-related transcriptional regulator [Gemmatimonadaceae bacterium]|jgi:DNA-binding CsgD family transcriptional regulator
MAATAESPETDALTRARAAFDRCAWSDAFVAFTEADAALSLAPDDLERGASVAHLLGRSADRDSLELRAHQGYLDRADVESAARCAFWVGFSGVMEGDVARGSGWLARAKRLLDDAERDSVIRGYLLMPQGIMKSMSNDAVAGRALFEEALSIARRFGDTTLAGFARNGIGRAMVRLGQVDEGLTLLDEVMAAIAAGEVGTQIVGNIYCNMIEACLEVFDLRRAQEWTDVLSEWCASQPDIVPFRGHCLTRRAEIMQLHGAWPDALEEARRACEYLTDPPGQRAAGPALYRCAELHRLRGSFVEAEAAYRAASDVGRNPHPGLALLWLAQGKSDAALGAVRRMLVEVQLPRQRAEVLEASIRILLSVGDCEAARQSATELAEIATTLGAPYLLAAAAQGAGSVLLAEGRASEALGELRTAWNAWQDLGAPFEAARTRVLIAHAAHALGDEETSVIELEAARRALTTLGAAAELIDAPGKALKQTEPDEALTEREREVLRLVATGKTNRAIASALGISEKTVARHVSNIFLKLDLSSRSAATAYAYERRLLKATST